MCLHASEFQVSSIDVKQDHGDYTGELYIMVVNIFHYCISLHQFKFFLYNTSVLTQLLPGTQWLHDTKQAPEAVSSAQHCPSA